MRTSLLVIALTAVALAATFALTAPAGTQHTAARAPVGIHKIKHVVVIMQENRSFDSYFGTFPGADGIPILWLIAACPHATCAVQFHRSPCPPKDLSVEDLHDE